MLLLGQPEFRTLLQTSSELEQLRQRVIASHHLDAMEPSEIGAYIEHRLACVGWQGNPAFDPRVYADLAKATGGVPRRVNQVVNRLLLMAAIEQRQTIDATLLQAVMADLAGDGGFNAKPAITPVPASEAPVVEMPAKQTFCPAAFAAAVFLTMLHGVPLWLNAMSKLPSFSKRSSNWPICGRRLLQKPVADPEIVGADWKRPIAGLPRWKRAMAMKRLSQHWSKPIIGLLRSKRARPSRSTAIRHTLSMMIEWIENEDYQRAAAA